MTAPEPWDKIWLRKGQEDTDDLALLSGFEKTTLNFQAAGQVIAEALNLKSPGRLLDVGCGVGATASEVLKHCPDLNYVGTERSASMARRHIGLSGRSVLNFSAHEAIFQDNFFDYGLCFSVAQYFESHEYAQTVVAQLARQAFNIFIGDLPVTSHDDTHLLYTQGLVEGWLTALKDRYPGLTWEFTPGLYNPNRFNVVIRRP
jgi:SAM-dependent methyltransferase